MRYVIETKDEQGTIGIYLAKMEKEGNLSIIEKGDTLIQIQGNLERVSKALDILKKAGYNSYVMKQYIRQETGLAKSAVDLILSSQEDFFKQIGVLKK